MTAEVSEARTEDVLRQRADKYAQIDEREKAKEVVDTVVVLGVGGQKIGVSVGNLDVIGKTPPVAHLPGLPSMVQGVLQHRGELLAAVDVARWMGISGEPTHPFTAIIEGFDGRKLCLLVDRVLGFREIEKGEVVESFFGSDKSEGRPVAGTTRDLVAIVDVEKLFDSPELKIEVGGDGRILG
jgi:chemotaxis signal transduction protein